MIKLSASIDCLFSELPLVERIGAAARIGLDAVEFTGYSGKDLEAVAAAADKARLPVAAFMVEAPQGMLNPELADAFVESTEKALAAAHVVDCKTLLCTTGNEVPGMDRNWGHAGIVACLRAAAPLAEAAGVTIVLEPLNVLVNHAGYFLSTSKEGFEIVEQVGSPAVKLLFDIYHQQITEGNLTANITSHIDQIGHFHAADVPGRHEPGTGEINWLHVLSAINEYGYEGVIGLEYRDSGSTGASLQHILRVREQING